MNLNDILLAQNIHRWTIVATKTKQSLAEHLFNVAMIARNIASEYHIDDSNVTKYALDHDLDEVMTGDIPSPAKTRMNIKPPYEGISMERCSEEEKVIVKAADLIDAYIFIKYNHYDRHGKSVYDYAARKIETFMSGVDITFPDLGNAIRDTLDTIEFGTFDCENREEWNNDENSEK